MVKAFPLLLPKSCVINLQDVKRPDTLIKEVNKYVVDCKVSTEALFENFGVCT